VNAPRIAVYAPTPTGGPPEYVAELLGAMARQCPGAVVTWPVRAGAVRRLHAVGQPEVLPSMAERAGLSRGKWLRQRLDPARRHDVAFLRWLRRHRDAMEWVLLEEYEPWTLPLLVWAARWCRLSVAVHVHNVTPHGYRGSTRERWALRLVRIGLAGAHVVSVHTEHNAAAARRLLRPRAEVRVIPHGLRPRRCSNPPAAGPPRFLFFGAYRDNKGLDVLVEALSALPDTRLTVAGPVPDSDVPAVAALLEPLGDRVAWDRRLVPDAELLALFDGVTAVVLPYREFEAQSGVLHLAIEMAVPVVVSDVGGLPETVRAHGIGLVAADASAAALVDALAAVADPARNVALRRNVVAAQSRLSWEASARGWWSALGRSVA
jgi:glycosyltransferase involved in cell wall biosynthesis